MKEWFSSYCTSDNEDSDPWKMWNNAISPLFPQLTISRHFPGCSVARISVGFLNWEYGTRCLEKQGGLISQAQVLRRRVKRIKHRENPGEWQKIQQCLWVRKLAHSQGNKQPESIRGASCLQKVENNSCFHQPDWWRSGFMGH